MERLKNMELKKTFLVLSASCVLVALLMLGLVFMICNSISSNFPSGGIEILADGSIVKMETPTETQQNILSMLGIIQIVSCIVLPMGGLALSGILYYHIKLKQPISTLRNGISRIRNHDLDFSMPVHLPHELSGGQQQRVAIARALIAKPDIIFADEPTGNLDSKSGGEVMEMLQSIWKKMGKTLVIITHDSRIARMADRQFVIVDGVLSEVTAR